ncbi:hypothetical protein ACROYT_G003648 [Oculina patagonica]
MQLLDGITKEVKMYFRSAIIPIIRHADSSNRPIAFLPQTLASHAPVMDMVNVQPGCVVIPAKPNEQHKVPLMEKKGPWTKAFLVWISQSGKKQIIAKKM